MNKVSLLLFYYFHFIADVLNLNKNKFHMPAIVEFAADFLFPDSC